MSLLAIRILILVFASVGVAGTAFLVWPTSEPEPSAPISSSKAPAPSAQTPAPPAPAPPPVASAVETLKGLTDQVGPQDDRADRAPSFDVARIDPSGEAVIAGRAAPGATVELLRGGVAHDRTVADPSGEFVLVPKPLPPGNYDLTLRATDQDGKGSTSKDSVAVELRSNGKEKPVVALTTPDKPAVVLSKPTTDADAAVELAIDAVEGEAGGRMYVSGRATPGASVNLYLNDAYIASGNASSAGRIAFSIRSGIRPGDYRVRLDQVDVSGRVQKRAEVPFKAPALLAAPAVPPKPQPPGSGATTDKMPDRTADKTAAAKAPDSAAPPSPAASAGTPPAPSESGQRVASAAPPANPQPAAPQTTPAPRSNASAPGAPEAAQAPPPAPKPPGPAASQQPPPPKDVTPPPASAPKPAPGNETETATARQPVPGRVTPPPASAPKPAPDNETETAAAQQPAPGGVTPPPASAPKPAPGNETETAAAPRPAPARITSAPESVTPPPEDVPPPATTPEPASAAPQIAAAPPAASSAPAHETSVVVIPSVDTTVVTRGDSLWRISQSTYGQGVRYSVIYKANREQIRNPDLIYPGQIFVLPKGQR